MDLYVYSLDDGSVTRLTDGSSQAIKPSWSPDGQYIVYLGVYDVGTGAGMAMEGMWAVRADGSEGHQISDPVGSNEEQLVGWIAPDTVVVYSSEIECGPFNLRAVNVNTGSVQVIWADTFRSVAINPLRGSLLLNVTSCFDYLPADLSPGLYLVPSVEDVAWQVLDGDISGLLDWSSDANLFAFWMGGEGAFTVTPTGEVTRLVSPEPGAKPSPAPGGDVWAWTATWQTPGLWIGPSDEIPIQVFAEPADLPAWGPEGQNLLFLGGEGLATLYVAHSPEFIPVPVKHGSVTNPSSGGVWVWP